MCDWNNNGKYDMQDAFISYHIHRSISGNKQNQSSSGDELTVVATVLLVVGIMLVIGMFISACEPKCAMSRCDNNAKDGSRYCYLHDLSYRTYGNPDYHEVYRRAQSSR